MSTVRPESDFMAPPVVERWQRTAMIAGAVGTLGAIVGWILEPDRFYQAFLFGYLWCLGLTLGCLALLMVYHMTGGGWGTLGRRIMEAATRTLPLMVVLFIPILIGLRHLYPWSRPEVVASDPNVARLARFYFSLPVFIARAVIYFGVWYLLAQRLNRISDRQDQPPEVVFDAKLRAISGIGFVIYAFSITLAVIDWAMSVDPRWSSSIYGLLFMAGQGILAFSFVVLVGAALKPHPPMAELWKPDQFLDYGKLMLAMVMMWGWFSLSQWLIIWSGDLPEEISWYLNRTRGGWQTWASVMLLVEFAIPFALLLSRDLKSNWRSLRWIALWLIAARYMDLYFIVMPSFPDRKGHFHYSWLDAVVPLALAGLWLTYFFWNLKRRPLLALHDAHVRLLMKEGHEHEPA
jgi:hypothetical protein